MKMSHKALESMCSDEIPDNEMRMESYLAWLSSGFIVFILVRMLLAKSLLFKNLDGNIRYLIDAYGVLSFRIDPCEMERTSYDLPGNRGQLY